MRNTVSAVPAVILFVASIGSWHVSAIAQAPADAAADSLTFDVASIRRNTSESTGGGGGRMPNGRYQFTNITIRSLISLTYGVPGGRVLGAPDWVAADRYDLVAIPKPNSTRAEEAHMLKSFLRDRLGLAVRVDERNFPVYLLVLMRPDGPAGPGIRPSPVDCSTPETRKKGLASAPPNWVGCGFRDSGGSFQGGGVSMSTLASLLAGAAGRPVLDKTGLGGGFDVELKWRSASDLDGGDGVGIFTALQEQLGLRLVSDEAPLQAVVIERIQRPSDN